MYWVCLQLRTLTTPIYLDGALVTGMDLGLGVGYDYIPVAVVRRICYLRVACCSTQDPREIFPGISCLPVCPRFMATLTLQRLDVLLCEHTKLSPNFHWNFRHFGGLPCWVQFGHGQAADLANQVFCRPLDGWAIILFYLEVGYLSFYWAW